MYTVFYMGIFPKANGRVELAESIIFKNLLFKQGRTVEYLD